MAKKESSHGGNIRQHYEYALTGKISGIGSGPKQGPSTPHPHKSGGRVHQPHGRGR